MKMKILQSLFVCLILVIGPVTGSFAKEDKGVKFPDGGIPAVVHSDAFGHTVALSGNHVLVGAPKANRVGPDGDKVLQAGTFYAFVRNKDNWEPQRGEKFNPKDVAKVSDHFGASASMSGNTAVIGAPGRDDAGENSGAAYIFVLSGNWEEQAKLIANDGAKGDGFGTAVSISRGKVIVGAPDDDDGGTSSGSAYIFVGKGKTWTQQAKLTAKDAAPSDEFGISVSISGNTAIVGAATHSHGGIDRSGAAYIFVGDGETWTQQAKLTAKDAAPRDRFGTSVAIHGLSTMIGAPRSDGVGSDSGAAYVFVGNGETWTQQAKLTPKDAEKFGQFGFSVSIIGNVALVGAYKVDDRDHQFGDAKDAGAAYSFMHEGGSWIEKVKLTPRSPEGLLPRNPFRFGISVFIDRKFAIVGAEGDNWTGAAYIYRSKEDLDLDVDVAFPVEPSLLTPTTLGAVKRTALYQNFPNPFNPETWLPYRLATEADVTFRIYNVQGHLVRQLPIGVQQTGDYLDKQTAAYWDGRDPFGEAVSSGLYVYTLQAGPYHATRRMLILK